MRRVFNAGGLCVVIGLICCGVSAKPPAETVVSPPLPLVSGLRLSMTLPAEWRVISVDKSGALSSSGFHVTVQRKLKKLIETCQITLQTRKRPVGRSSTHGEIMRNMDGIMVQHEDPGPQDKVDDWFFWIWHLEGVDDGDAVLSCSFRPCNADDQLELCRWISEHIDFLPDAHPATTVKP